MRPTATASLLQELSQEPEDDETVAASCHGDTPDVITKICSATTAFMRPAG
jgi:hypothetical protein